MVKILIVSSSSEFYSKLCSRPLVAEFQGPRSRVLKIMRIMPSWKIRGRRSASKGMDELSGINRAPGFQNSIPNGQATSTSGGTDVERTADLGQKRFRGEVSQLNTCAHLLHSKCLAIWWLGNQMACPVCGDEYWQPEAPPRHAVARVARRGSNQLKMSSVTISY